LTALLTQVSQDKNRDGPVVVDLRVVQIPSWRGRGAARYAYEFALALENHRPDLVSRYLLAPELPPPGDINELLRSGKVAYSGQADWLPRHARVFHSLSPLESGCRPPEVEHRGLSYSATVYDLVPLRFEQELPPNPWRRHEYLGRTVLLKVADAVLAVSEATRRDLIEILGLEPGRSWTVGLGRPRHLTPAGDPASALEQVKRLVSGVSGPYLLYPAGPSPRKNADRLVTAFAQLPDEIRASRQLVICADLGAQRGALGLLASELGVADRLLMPGHVPDTTLEALYQGAEVVCVPSLGEGSGLTVAEAMACGAVVVASDISPLDEYVAPEARFDPTDVASIARVLTRAVSDVGFRTGQTSPARSWVWTRTWEDVVDEAAKVFEHLASRRTRPWRRAPLVAVVSPFPPVMSGIAGYSDRLVAALVPLMEVAYPGAELDCFADGRYRCPDAAALEGGRKWRDAHSFLDVDSAVGGYDRIVYVLGNSEYHAGALACLRRRPGIVMAHDVRLSGLLKLSGFRESVPGGLAAAITRSYGSDLRLGLQGRGDIDPADLERHGLLMMRDVIASAEKVLVSSESARRLAAVDAGPEYSQRLAVLPFAIALDDASLTVVSEARTARDPARALVASFGILDPAKQPTLVVQAIGLLAETFDADLVFVGPVSDELKGELTGLAAAIGLGERMTILGHVPRSEYLSYLGRADVAVQLRASFYGESSAAVGECLASGLPTVVSDIGWMGDLPDTCVRKVHPRASATELADAIGRLLAEPTKRATLAQRAAEFAASQTFEAAAAALLAELGLRAP
jgi:glycosyltransferase involved in cell wall biosynthesis